MSSAYHFVPQQRAMICKEEVVAWFRLLNGSQRIETLCALLDCCVPFEVRFIGSVIEDLGRRDFHELRDVDHKANHFATTSKSPEANKLALYNALAAEPGQLNVNTNPTGPYPPNNVDNTASHQSIQLRSAFIPSQDARNNRPNSSNNPEGKPRTWFDNQQLQTALSKSSNSKALTPVVNGSSMSSKTGTNSSSNCSAEDDNEEDARNSPPAGGDLLVLSVDRTRQRMILYLALLTATNREAASSFYALMSQVEQTVGCPGWLENLEEIVLEEVALLYTLGAHHPAFSFEQRIMLAEILSQVRSQLYKHKVQRNYYYTQAVPYDPKYAVTQPHYYLHYATPYPPQNMSQVQVQPQQQQQQLTSSAPQTTSVQQTSQAVAGANMVALPQTVDTSRIQPQPQPQPVYYYHPYSYIGQQPQPQHHPQIVANPSQTRIMPVPPMSPRAAGMPVPNPGGVGPDKFRQGKPEGVPTPVNDMESLSPGLSSEVNVVVQHPRRISCFNCGESTHAGIDCPVPRMEEITQSLYRVRFNAPNPSSETTDSTS